MVKKVERELGNTLLKKVKVVEGNSTHLQHTLTKQDPWNGEDCERPSCVICTSYGDKKPDCRTRNTTYRTTCKLCMGESVAACFIGETSRSMKERIGEHLEDLRKDMDGSHMAQHLKDTHPEVWEKKNWEPKNMFMFDTLKSHATSCMGL